MPMLSDPLLSSPARPPASQPSLLYTLWGAFLQAFTVDETFQRKIK